VQEKNIETGTQEQELGRSKGGFTTKLHAACDALGNPVRFFITPGQRSYYVKALEMIENIPMKALLADKGYDANYIADAVLKIKAEVVIPPRSKRKNPREYDVDLYKERNIIERMFNKMKNFRRIATRYDKLGIAYLGFVFIVGTYLWLK
jgi:transposase